MLGAALLLAIPAAALTHEAFRPFALRLVAEGRGHHQTFALPKREPLYLEYELIVRDFDGERPRVVVLVNGTPAATLQASSAFATERGRVLLPLEPLRDGENELRIAFDPAASAGTFELRARLHNYFGIAPDFPRAAVVADQAVAHVVAQRTPLARAGRFAIVYLACLALMVVLTRLYSPQHRGGWTMLAVPLVLPWAAAAYSLATPRHLWLSVPAAAVLALVPWFLARAAVWLAARGAAVRQVLVVAAVCLVTLEGGLRLFNAVVPTFVFYSDSYNRFRGQPGARFFDTVFNSRGFNDVERQVTRPPGVRRVIAVGDSFAVGVVPRTGNYLNLLERALGEVGPVEVVNMGVAGTAPADYLALLVDEGLSMSPDLVIAGFYLGNDFETRTRRLHDYSYTATLGRALWRLATARPAAPAAGGTAAAYDDAAPTMPRARFLEILVDRAWLYERDAAPLTGRAIGAADTLRQMRDLARRAGGDMLVVLIPDEIQVDAGILAEVARARGRTPGDFDLTQPTRAIATALDQAGVPYLDLGPAFAARASQERLYKPQDTHWNLAGNRLAAEVMAPAVRDRLVNR